MEFLSPAIVIRLFIFLCIMCPACTLPAEREAKKAEAQKQDTATVIQSTEVHTAQVDTAKGIVLPPVKKIKSPEGIYQVSIKGEEPVEQTIVFNGNRTYRLQEAFKNHNDSTVVTEGIWNPSDGYIWLYKDQVVRGRYTWKDNTLQYYSPELKKNLSMAHLQDALENKSWENKGREGILVFGVGNEPFWSVEFNKKDSIVFQLADWEHPLKLKVDSSFTSSDSSGYLARSDSNQIRLIVYRRFCSDGMSDYTYRHAVRVTVNKQVYQGCGNLYKP